MKTKKKLKILSVFLAVVLTFGLLPGISLPTKAAGYVWPVANGKLGCGFQCGCSTHNGKHSGIDINGVAAGTPVVAINSGTVTCVNNWQSAAALCPTCQSSGAGYHVEIHHGNNIYAQYAHLSGTAVSIGQTVSAGQVIGYVGNTGYSFGNHLHLTISISNPGWGHLSTNYQNPLNYVSPTSAVIDPITRIDVSDITETSATIKSWFTLQTYSEVGFYFGTSTSNMTKTREVINTVADRSWYKLAEGSWYGPLTPGTKYYYQMYVIVNGKEYKSDTGSFTTKGSPQITGISIAQKPNQLIYRVGDSLNTEGLKLSVTYSNGTTELRDYAYICNPKTLTTAGTQKISVSYLGYTTSFTVTVQDVQPEISGSMYIEKRKEEPGYITIITGVTADEIISCQGGLYYNPEELELIRYSAIDNAQNWESITIAGPEKNKKPGTITFFANSAAKSEILTGKQPIIKAVFRPKNETLTETTLRAYCESACTSQADQLIEITIPECNSTVHIDQELILLGDLNSDGKVDTQDGVLTARYLAKWAVRIDQKAADINGDGKVNATDGALLSRHLAKWQVSYFQ